MQRIALVMLAFAMGSLAHLDGQTAHADGGMMMVTVSPRSIEGYSGFLLPGMLVDVQIFSRGTLYDIPVVLNRPGGVPTGGAGIPQTPTLLVTPQQARLLEGALRVELVARDPARRAAKTDAKVRNASKAWRALMSTRSDGGAVDSSTQSVAPSDSGAGDSFPPFVAPSSDESFLPDVGKMTLIEILTWLLVIVLTAVTFDGLLRTARRRRSSRGWSAKVPVLHRNADAQ